MLLIASLPANVVLALMHALVPIALVSVVGNVAAILFAIVAIGWGIMLLIGSNQANVKAVRV